MILAGHASGDAVRLALFTPEPESPRLVRAASVPAHAHAGLRPLVRRFVAAERAELSAAGFAVPAGAEAGAADATAWPVEAGELAAACGLEDQAAEVVSEAVAAGEWLLRLDPGELRCVWRGSAAATGLGVLLWLGERPGAARLPPGAGPGAAVLPWDGAGPGPAATSAEADAWANGCIAWALGGAAAAAVTDPAALLYLAADAPGRLAPLIVPSRWEAVAAPRPELRRALAAASIHAAEGRPNLLLGLAARASRKEGAVVH